MAKQESDTAETLARETLELCKNTIAKTKPTKKQIKQADVRQLQPSEPKHSEEIRYFNRVSQSVFLGRGS